jgi:hypothetical protein
MRIPALPLIASIALFAVPAFAQTSGATATQPNGGSAHAYSNYSNNANSQNPNDQNQGMNGPQNSQQYGKTSQQDQQSAEGVTSDTRQALRQSLLRSGFRDVNVEPQTYVIHAKAPDGSHIAMLVGPDQISGVVMGKNNNNNNNNNSSQANRSLQNGSSNWSRSGTGR